MTKFIHEEDIIEVLPGCVFRNLVYSKGTVVQSLNSGFALVRFQSIKHWSDEELGKVQGLDWLVPWSKLKVLDSPHDTHLGKLEEEILGLESDLVTARCCISMSEELRETQHDLIQKLIEDIDVLRKELYLARGN